MSSNIQVQKRCEFCGESFIAKTLFTRYCSKKCNTRHYKQLVKSQKVEIHINQSNHNSAQMLASMDNEYLAMHEAAIMMRVSKRTLYRLIADNKLKKKKIMSRSVILKKDIQTFFDYQ